MKINLEAIQTWVDDGERYADFELRPGQDVRVWMFDYEAMAGFWLDQVSQLPTTLVMAAQGKKTESVLYEEPTRCGNTEQDGTGGAYNVASISRSVVENMQGVNHA